MKLDVIALSNDKDGQPSAQNQDHPYAKIFPLFSCKQHHEKSSPIQHCVYEKILISINFILIFFLFHQVWFVYIRKYKVKKDDGRIIIFILCIASAIYNFIHYGCTPSAYKGHTFFVLELFRFLIMFCICYYHSYKASGLLKDKKLVIKYLKIWGAISTTGIIVMGIIIFQ